MNVTGMLIPSKPMQAKVITRECVPKELTNVFNGLLQTAQIPNPLGNQTGEKPEPKSSEDLLKSLFSQVPEEVKEKLLAELKESDNIDQIGEGLHLSAGMMQQLKALIDVQLSSTDNKQVPVEQTRVAATITPIVVPINKKEVLQQLGDISKKAESLLSSLTDQKSIAKLAPEIQKLLEKWTSLENKLGATKEVNIASLNQSSANGTKTETVWRELVSAFQKRNQFVTSQQYNTNAKVTSTDITKWISNALSKQKVSEQSTTMQANLTTMPISKVEQYVIHLNQTQNTQNNSQQLVDKFQDVIKTSKFLTLNNGSSQLNISIKPTNLGEMMVKLTQINGEMTVKIIVASAAAKEMLESNMTQLKHMFSPQQVVIEKQEMQTQQSQNLHQDKDQQSMDNDDQSQSDNPNKDEQKQSSEEFERFFQEVLMNEKV
ncbi:flagellar hook-length control protein FliK [Virgibacillus flavescens]|uniref:flagellar hook-length control protein FliK n=1 Tax=Virgibacillus flavescens TaxID=1611422 RepID=UPI003D33727D